MSSSAPRVPLFSYAGAYSLALLLYPPTLIASFLLDISFYRSRVATRCLCLMFGPAFVSRRDAYISAIRPPTANTSQPPQHIHPPFSIHFPCHIFLIFLSLLFSHACYLTYFSPRCDTLSILGSIIPHPIRTGLQLISTPLCTSYIRIKSPWWRILQPQHSNSRRVS
jgi:hypothetical protein